MRNIESLRGSFHKKFFSGSSWYFLLVYILIIVNFTNFYYWSGLAFDPLATTPLEEYFQSYYFSVVTITTLGYGDVQASTALSRSLVVIELLAGIYVFARFIASRINEIAQKEEIAFDHFLLEDKWSLFFESIAEYEIGNYQFMQETTTATLRMAYSLWFKRMNNIVSKSVLFHVDFSRTNSKDLMDLASQVAVLFTMYERILIEYPEESKNLTTTKLQEMRLRFNPIQKQETAVFESYTNLVGTNSEA